MAADLSFLETDSQQIYENVISSLEESVGEPLYPGDERRVFGDALVALFVSIYNEVNDACKQKMLQYARGEVLDAIGARYNCTRIIPSVAHTTLRFSIKSMLSRNIIIEEGTRVTPDNEIYFQTSRTVVLQTGDLYVDVPAVACETGAIYNGYAIGTLNQLVDLVPYIDEVTNTVETFDGDDGEPYPEKDGGIGDDKYRERIKLAPTALSVAGPHDAYKYHVLSADSTIADAAIVSKKETVNKSLNVYGGSAFLGGPYYYIETLSVSGLEYNVDYTVHYTDNLLMITLLGDNANLQSITVSIEKDMAGEVLIVPILQGGMIPDKEMLDKILEVCNADDVRPMTDKVIVQAPEQVNYDINIEYYTTPENESDCIETIEGSTGAIKQFIEWQGTKLGRDVNPDKLRSLCLAPTSGVGCSRIVINSPVYQELKDTQVAVYSGNLTVTHKVGDE